MANIAKIAGLQVRWLTVVAFVAARGGNLGGTRERDRVNIAGALARAAAQFPDRPAIIFEDRIIQYADLLEQSKRIARGLRAAGVERGDRVVLFLPNIPAFAPAFLGIEHIGAIAVSLNSMLTVEELPYFIEDCGAKVAFSTAEMAGRLAPAPSPRTALAQIVICEGEDATHTALRDFEMADDGSQPVECEADTPAAILYTSGTTGRQKGATLSHGNVLSNIYTGNRVFKTTERDVISLFLPLFHCFGQNVVMMSALAAGATLVMHRRYEQAAVVDAIEKHRVTMLFAPPAVFIGIVNAGIPPKKLASLRHALSGAAPLPIEISQKWSERYGTDIREGYGLTETSPLACYNHEWGYVQGKVGTPIDLVDIKIVDENDAEVASGTWGEVCIKGPNVMLGYWRKPEATAQAIRNGWFHTGDIGYVDEAGYLAIVDRVKDMINCAGFKVWPREVEEVLFRHPMVKDCAVVGIPDAQAGEAVKAYIVPHESVTRDSADLESFCRTHIATYKIPREFEFTDAIPKNPTGKTLKRVLRERQQA